MLQNNIFLHNNALTPTDMRQHYLRGLPFLVSKIYHFEVRCSFVVIKILLCRSCETKQGCRLAWLSDKGIMKFYARNQYFLMNTQPTDCLCFLLFSVLAPNHFVDYARIGLNDFNDLCRNIFIGIIGNGNTVTAVFVELYRGIDRL